MLFMVQLVRFGIVAESAVIIFSIISMYVRSRVVLHICASIVNSADHAHVHTSEIKLD